MTLKKNTLEHNTENDTASKTPFYFLNVKRKCCQAVSESLSRWTSIWRRKGKVSICNAIKSISWLVEIEIWKSMYPVMKGNCSGSWHHVASTRFEPCHSVYPHWNRYSSIKCGRDNNPISICSLNKMHCNCRAQVRVPMAFSKSLTGLWIQK